MSAHPEWDFQEKAHRYLKAALPDHAYVQGRDSGQAAPKYVKLARIRRGIVSGDPDHEVFLDGRKIAFEMKAGDRHASLAQRAQGVAIMKNGGWWFEVRTLAGIESGLRTAGIVPLVTAADYEVRWSVHLANRRPARQRSAAAGVDKRRIKASTAKLLWG